MTVFLFIIVIVLIYYCNCKGFIFFLTKPVHDKSLPPEKRETNKYISLVAGGTSALYPSEEIASSLFSPSPRNWFPFISPVFYLTLSEYPALSAFCLGFSFIPDTGMVEKIKSKKQKI
jgi:hypothetical protein